MERQFPSVAEETAEVLRRIAVLDQEALAQPEPLMDRVDKIVEQSGLKIQNRRDQ